MEIHDTLSRVLAAQPAEQRRRSRLAADVPARLPRVLLVGFRTQQVAEMELHFENRAEFKDIPPRRPVGGLDQAQFVVMLKKGVSAEKIRQVRHDAPRECRVLTPLGAMPAAISALEHALNG
jgi:hypothetical protein